LSLISVLIFLQIILHFYPAIYLVLLAIPLKFLLLLILASQIVLTKWYQSHRFSDQNFLPGGFSSSFASQKFPTLPFPKSATDSFRFASMATSPSPFFFPTTAPAYAPTAVFSPPPFGFEAVAYGQHIFQSAATYISPFSPDGYSTPSSGSPNWPPPAAHPIPAAAYPPAFPYVVPSPTQTPGFSAAPAYHYMPASTAPPATDCYSSPAHQTFFYHPPVQGTPQTTAAPTAPDREDVPPQRQASTPVVDSARFF
jgi:hypothetical protein